MKFIKMDNRIACQYDGYIKSPFIISFIETNTGQLVCSEQCLEEFPELFKDISFERIELGQSDFMPDYSNIELVVDGKYPVVSMMQDFVKKQVTTIYIVDGEKKEVITKMDEATVTNTGYSVDMEEKIREKEFVISKIEIKAEKIQPKVKK